MLNGYIDDSGSEPSSPVFVLAGYVLPPDTWTLFSGEWARTLSTGKPIGYLHMKEIGQHVQHKGQFSGWSMDEIEDKLLSLAQVISRYEPLGLSAHTEWSVHRDFLRKSSLAKYIQNPYKLLFHEITRLMYDIGKRWNNPDCVDFFFDEQGGIGEEASSWYRDMKEAFDPHARASFGSAPRFKDDKSELPLQAADMFAWFQRRRLTQPVTRPSMREIERLITRGFAAGSEADEQSYEKAARDFQKVERLRALNSKPYP